MLVRPTPLTTALRAALLGIAVVACSPSLGAYVSASQGASESAAESGSSEGTSDASGVSETATSGSSTSATSTSTATSTATSDASSSTSTGGAPLCPDCDALCSGTCAEIDPLIVACEACQDCGECDDCPDCPTCMDCQGDECGVKLIVCIHSLACPALTESYDAEIAGQAVQDFGAALRCVACHLGTFPCQAEENDCRADATCDARRQCVDRCSCLDDAARTRCEGACPDPDDPRWLAWRECDAP